MYDTSSRLVYTIKELNRMNKKAPCKKVVQKIVYLMEEKGCDFGFDYRIHFYGPYSSDLDYEIQKLNAEGVLKVEYTNFGHLLSVREKVETPNIDEETTSTAEITTAKKEMETINISENREMQEVLQRFGGEAPFSLELLSTTLFTQRALETNKDADIVSGVQKIKGSKYSDAAISEAMRDLREAKYF